MKGYTIQNSIDLLEKGGSGAGGSTTASNVSFDNTGTGLVANNVQAAIDEVYDNLDKHVFSTTEKIVGKYLNNEDVAEITLTGTITPAQGTYSLIIGTLENLGASKLLDANGVLLNTDAAGGQSILVPAYVNASNTTGIYVTSTGEIKLYISGAYHEYNITLTYIKASNQNKSRKRKKEE